MSGSTFANGEAITYSGTTGLPTQTIAVDAAGTETGAPITTGYDAWGRPTTYEPAPGETTTTNYNNKGQVSSVADPRGTTTYYYDGATPSGPGDDINGKSERGGLLTRVDVSRPGQPDAMFSGAYDAAEALTIQKLPGWITQRMVWDKAGALESMTYSGDTRGLLGTVTADRPWLSWSRRSDYLGRLVREWNPGGGTTCSNNTVGSTVGTKANAADIGYEYDPAGRLVRVVDRKKSVGGGVIDPLNPLTTVGTICQYRLYDFDGASQSERR